MRIAPLLLALPMLASLALTSRADAQAINANATIYVDDADGDSDDEEKLKNGSNVFISRAKCNGNWRFELQGYFTPVPFLEMWATNNTSTNCADQANRSSATNTQPVCWQVTAYQNAVRGKTTFEVPGGKVFDRSGTCPSDIAGTKFKVQFVTLDSPTQMNTATVTASNNNPNQVSAILTLYSKVPAAPSNIETISGGRQIGIRYDKIDNDPLTEYRAYFDHAADAPIISSESMDGGAAIDAGPVACGTGKFNDVSRPNPDGGTAITSPATGSDVTIDNMVTFQSGKTKGDSLTIRDLDEKNIPYDTYTAVSVFAIDGAGNAGDLSTPICVKRVRTDGYLARCRDAGVDCGELESCSLSPRNTGSAFWLSACTLALSAWARRRRRSI